MITCPECSQQATDDAKFCERCGRALDAASTPTAESISRPSALAVGVTLKHNFEILEVIAGTSLENRYRARNVGSGDTVILRERTGPAIAAGTAALASTELDQPDADTANLQVAEDPSGPRAKTAELKPVAPQTSASGNATENTSIGGDHADSLVEAATDSAQSANPDGDAADEPSSPSIANNNGRAPEEAVAESAPTNEPADPASAPASSEPSQDHPAEPEQDDLGEVFGRVMALSMTLTHPAFQRAQAGFAEDGRVYLVYADEPLKPFDAPPIPEPEAISAAIQICQAISFLNRRGLRVNDICPQSVAIAASGRIKLTGLDYVTNDNELATDAILNDGYTAPEIYRGKRTDKRADVFSAGALLYTWLTGDRLESESWREEAGPVRFYPPYVVTPELEQAVLRAIQFDPAARWTTIDEFKAELIRLLGRYRIRVAARTDVGMVRDHNEDAVMVADYVRDSLVEPDQNYLCVVCDGMGGAEAGEVAAAIAVATIRDYVENRLAAPEGADPGKLMTAALEEANSKILEYAAAHPQSRGMGSTGVSILITPSGAAVSWCGDSRGYLLESGQLRQITKDHSLVQRLIDIGQITPAEARTHEHKNVITRSLGARPSGPAGAEALPLKLKRGDRMLLCSDGLTTHVEDQDIATILRRHNDPDDAARELIAAANAGGGTDNISVIVLHAS